MDPGYCAVLMVPKTLLNKWTLIKLEVQPPGYLVTSLRIAAVRRC